MVVSKEIEGLVKFRNEFNDPDLSIWDFVKYKSDFDLAYAFSRVFFPEFVEVEGCVLLAVRYESENFAEWKNKLGGDRRQIESMVNHVHIYDLFSAPANESEVGTDVCEEIARSLVKSWTVALNDAFPGKSFEFHLSSEADDYGPTITFFQTSS